MHRSADLKFEISNVRSGRRAQKIRSAYQDSQSGCLAGRGGPAPFEVIVAAARDRIDPVLAPEGVRWLAAEPGAGVPRLRRLGLDAARAPVVAFTEDSCRLGPGWVEAWLQAFRDPLVPAATGPVAPAMGDSALDWAVFFCEYAPFLPSGREGVGPPDRLAGNNFAIRHDLRDALDRAEVHETEVLRAASASSGGLALVSPARADHVRRYGWREAFGDRFRFGLEYGRLRAGRLPTRVRPVGLVVGPAVLAVQAARLVAVVLGRPTYLGPFARALPLTLALLSAWSAGEWLGWASAAIRPRTSCRRRGTAARRPARSPAPAWSSPGRYRSAPPRA